MEQENNNNNESGWVNDAFLRTLYQEVSRLRENTVTDDDFKALDRLIEKKSAMMEYENYIHHEEKIDVFYESYHSGLFSDKQFLNLFLDLEECIENCFKVHNYGKKTRKLFGDLNYFEEKIVGIFKNNIFNSLSSAIDFNRLYKKIFESLYSDTPPNCRQDDKEDLKELRFHFIKSFLQRQSIEDNTKTILLVINHADAILKQCPRPDADLILSSFFKDNIFALSHKKDGLRALSSIYALPSLAIQESVHHTLLSILSEVKEIQPPKDFQSRVAKKLSNDACKAWINIHNFYKQCILNKDTAYNLFYEMNGNLDSILFDAYKHLHSHVAAPADSLEINKSWIDNQGQMPDHWTNNHLAFLQERCALFIQKITPYSFPQKKYEIDRYMENLSHVFGNTVPQQLYEVLQPTLEQLNAQKTVLNNHSLNRNSF
jgi:hypothetical protein